MTREERACIDDLIEYLDNHADGAEDAGAFARNCTNWHPALVLLKARAERLEAELDTIRQDKS
jgi:hypothetical protein